MTYRLAAAALAAAVAGCTETNTDPLYFGQVTTLGVSVGAGAASPTGDVTVGYRNANVAIVPTKNSADSSEVRALISNQASDALSTFGSFESESSAGSVRLGQFFSTGLPGQRLAGGLGCAAAIEAANGQGVTCNIEN